MTRNQAASKNGAQKAPTIASATLNALYDEKQSWRAVADAIGDVSPALCWKVAHGVTESSKIDKALGIPTQRRCKANGWVRRAVWVHKDDLPQLEKEIAAAGCETFSEYVDRLRG